MARRPSIPTGVVQADAAMKLILKGTAPDGMKVAGDLKLFPLRGKIRLPNHLTVNALTLINCGELERLPDGLNVRRLYMTGPWNPQHLLDGLSCYDLSLKDSAVTAIP